MLRPDKHTNVKYSIVFVSATIMKEIISNGIISYDELRNSIYDKIGKEVSENFQYALSYLYLLGRIEYVPSLDSFKPTI